jgi:hypothetical protein
MHFNEWLPLTLCIQTLINFFQMPDDLCNSGENGEKEYEDLGNVSDTTGTTGRALQG